MNEHQAAAFEDLRKRWPWVTEKDRPALELTAKLYARVINDPTDEMGVGAMNLLRMNIAQFGGTPSDFSKIESGNDDEPEPAARFFEN